MRSPLEYLLDVAPDHFDAASGDVCGMCGAFEKEPLPGGILICPHCDHGHPAESCPVCRTLFPCRP